MNFLAGLLPFNAATNTAKFIAVAVVIVILLIIFAVWAFKKEHLEPLPHAIKRLYGILPIRKKTQG